jgi:hypothetical protein
MIHLNRLGEPAVLAERKAEWQVRYDARRAASPKSRPESKQYAHRQVVETLAAMSHRKCFYCEGQGKLEVDHYVEVAERPDLAFVWENLYLACTDCQRKQPNTSIPVTACVDPCDDATDPREHLEFDAEYVRFRTQRGEETIRKYGLERELLVSERRRMLQRFNAELIKIAQTGPWRSMSAADRRRLLRYRQADSPFSSMFAAYLDALHLADG